MDRRSFIKLSSLAGASVAVSTGLAGCVSSTSAKSNAIFTHGVASGDPLQSAVIIWTRALPESPSVKADVLWEVANDSNFANVIASGIVEAAANNDFTVKVDVTGLSPDNAYFYRFVSANNVSPVGLTKTLPSRKCR